MREQVLCQRGDGLVELGERVRVAAQAEQHLVDPHQVRVDHQMLLGQPLGDRCVVGHPGHRGKHRLVLERVVQVDEAQSRAQNPPSVSVRSHR